MAMRRWAAVAAVVVTATIGLAANSGAMTSLARSDGDAHPAVVSLLVRGASGRLFQYCSGTLVTRALVVTASHCTSSAERSYPPGSLFVTNDPVLPGDGAGGVRADALAHLSPVATIVTNPAYRPVKGTDSYREDVSALVVADPGALARPGLTYPSLPAPGVLDSLQRNGTLRSTVFQVMGYGTEEQVVGPGGPTFADSGERRVADMTAKALGPQVLHESQSINKAQAGACYGDSGGPTFVTVGGVWTIVGVTSTGDIPCWSTNTASRIDRDSVLAFLAPLVAATR